MMELLLKKYLEGFSAETILDVGPGYGNFSRVAAHVTGATQITFLDYNPSILAWQADECKKVALTPECLTMSLNVADLSKLDGTYDLILCQEILEHLLNAEEVLTTLVQRLSINGRIVVTVPTKRSEQWLKRLNPHYMRNEPYGHVREFDEHTLREILKKAGLSLLVFIPTQPHYFVVHTWIFGSRMKVEGSTGKVISSDIRNLVADRLMVVSKRFFMLTGFERWGRLLPRNYFVIATRGYHGNSF